MIRHAATVFSRAAARHFDSQRLGDQYGTLLAGAWSLLSDVAPTAVAAELCIASHDWESYRQSSEGPDEVCCLQTILLRPVGVESDVRPLSPTPEPPRQRLRSSGSQLPPTTGRATGRAARARMRSAAFQTILLRPVGVEGDARPLSPTPELPRQRLRSSGSQLPPTTGRATGRAARARMRSAASRPSSCFLWGWKVMPGPSPAPSLSWWAWWPAMTGARRSARTWPSRPAMSPPQQRLRLQEKEKRLLLSNSARVIEQIPSRIPPGPTAGQRSSPVCFGSAPVCSGLLWICSGPWRRDGQPRGCHPSRFPLNSTSHFSLTADGSRNSALQTSSVTSKSLALQPFLPG